MRLATACNAARGAGAIANHYSGRGTAGALVQRELLRASSADAILAVVSRHRPVMDRTNVLTAVQRLSRMQNAKELGMTSLGGSAFSGLLDELESCSVRCGPRDLADAASGLAVMRVSGSHRVWKALGATLADCMRHGECTGTDLSKSLSAFATARSCHEELFLAATAPQVVAKLEIERDLSGTVWAIATVHYSPSAEFIEAVYSRATRGSGLKTFAESTLSTFAWAMCSIAEKDCGRGAMLGRMAVTECTERKDVSARGFIGTLMAYARSRAPADEARGPPRKAFFLCIQVLLDAASRRLREFVPGANATQLSMAVFAMATLRHSCPQLFADVARRSMALLGSDSTAAEFDETAVSKMLSAYGSSRLLNQGLSKTLVDHAFSRIGVHNLSAQSLSNLAQAAAAFKQLKFHEIWADECLTTLSKALSSPEASDQLSAQTVARALSAYAISRHQGADQIVESMGSSRTSSTLVGAVPKDIMHISRSFATLKWCDHSVLEVLANETCTRIDDFRNVQLASLMWSFAALHVFDCPLASTVDILDPGYLLLTCSSSLTLSSEKNFVGGAHRAADSIEKVLHERGAADALPPAVTAELLWALAVCGRYASILFHGLLQSCSRCLHPSHGDATEAMQLAWKAALGFILEHGSVRGVSRTTCNRAEVLASREDLLDALPHLREISHHAQQQVSYVGDGIAEQSELRPSDQAFVDVAKQMDAHGFQVSANYGIEGILVDLALADRNVGFNALGKKRLVRGHDVDSVPDGMTLLEDRLLRRLGWRVLWCHGLEFVPADQRHHHLSEFLREKEQ